MCPEFPLNLSLMSHIMQFMTHEQYVRKCHLIQAHSLLKTNGLTARKKFEWTKRSLTFQTYPFTSSTTMKSLPSPELNSIKPSGVVVLN